MPKYKINGPAGPIYVDIAGDKPSAAEIPQITQQYAEHAKSVLSSKGMQPPSTTMDPAQAGLAASGIAGAAGPMAAGLALGDPFNAPPLAIDKEQDARSLAISQLAERERGRMVSERTENLVDAAASTATGFGLGAASGLLGRTALSTRTIGQLAETGAARRGLGLAGRVGLNVGAGGGGAAASAAYRKIIDDRIASGDLPPEFARPDFTSTELKNRVLWDLALGGGAEVGLSGFRGVRRLLTGVPDAKTVQGTFATARDLGLEGDVTIANVTKNKLLEGFGRLMGSMPVIRGFVRGGRAKQREAILGAYEKLFNNPFAPRSLFERMGITLDKAVRKDVQIAYEAADYKLNKARMLSEERGVGWEPTEILSAVDDSMARRSDLAIPTTFQRMSRSTTETTRTATTEAERALAAITERRAASQGVSRDITKTEDLLRGSEGASDLRTEAARGRAVEGATSSQTTAQSTSTTRSKVDYDKTITVSGSVPDFVGNTNVDEWMVALGGMDPTRKMSANDIMGIKRGINEAWNKGSLSHEQKTFLFDLERATDRMLENAPDPEVAKLIREGWSDLAQFHRYTATPAARTFEHLDKNVFERTSLQIPGGKYRDELFDFIVTGLEKGGDGSSRWGAERIRDLHELMGTSNLRVATDTWLSRMGQRHVHKLDSGEIQFDWNGLRKDLGVNELTVRREGLDEALRLSGSPRGVDDIGKSIDFLEKTYGKTWTDPATMQQRRFAIGGMRSLTGMFAAGAVTGAFGAAGPWGLAVAAQLGLLGRYLNNPKALRTIIAASERNMTDAAFINTQRQLVEMFAKDMAIQVSERGEPTPEEIDTARQIVEKVGGVPTLFPTTGQPAFLPPSMSDMQERVRGQQEKLQGIADYLRGK